MENNDPRLMAIEDKKDGIVTKRHYFLLPDHVEYEDDQALPFDFRINVMSQIGAKQHSPILNEQHQPSVFEQVSEYGRYKNEYHQNGQRIGGPNGFAVELTDGYGKILSGNFLNGSGEVDENRFITEADEIVGIALKHRQTMNANGRNTLRAAGIKTPYLV